MKHVYSLTILALVFIAIFVPQTISAQCTCSGGLPATPITYTATLAPSNVPGATISFPQFDPSIGNLSCVTLHDTISGVSTTGARNLNSSTALLPPSNPLYTPTGRMEYSFLLNVSTKVQGPGITLNKSFTMNYGPDSLGAYGQPDDTITYGPDNIYTNYMASGATGAVGAYLGLGTVDFSYNIIGGLIATEGSLNYHDQIVTTYSGNFGLTYYWCPALPLATTITEFSATDKGKYVQLQWKAANDQNNIVYEIQYSTDGTQFYSVGNKAADNSATGTVSEYQYQYNLNPANVGQIYFRIKRTDANGNSTYSVVKEVHLDAGATLGIQTYPNPVVNTVTLSFDEAQTGSFMIELVSITGQVMQQQAMTLTSASQARFDLNGHPARGMYFLRTKDISHSKQYVTKVLIE